MPAYEVEIEHRNGDQIFSYYHGEGMLHFNATLLGRLHRAMPDEFVRITMDLDEAQYNLCMEHRGIEEAKIAALRPADLRMAGYGVMLDEHGTFTIIDGHHRLVKRWRDGLRTMDLWITVRQVWQHCLVQYDKSFEEHLAKGMPARVEDATRIASEVVLHLPRKKP